jgi:hypothetical protein
MTTKKTRAITRKDVTTVPFEPNKMGLAIAALSVVILLLLTVIVTY